MGIADNAMVFPQFDGSDRRLALPLLLADADSQNLTHLNFSVFRI
jgi:hypothetical protein